MQTQAQIFARIIHAKIQEHAEQAITALEQKRFDDFRRQSAAIYALQKAAEAAHGCGIITAAQNREIAFAVKVFRQQADDLFSFFEQKE